MTLLLQWILLAVLMLPSVPTPAQGEPFAAPQAVVPHPRFEFNPVVEGSVVVHDFVLRNQGQAVLEIGSVQTG
jgi:hypothetical protein